MAETRSGASRKGNYDRKRVKRCGGVKPPWSDLDHDLLDLVMMRLGVVEFVSFSGVCKSWRSLAHLNWKRFMASRPPMVMYVSPRDYKKACCYLHDFEGRLFKTTIPHSVGRQCVGLSCGYLILFGEKTRDFWLVNPITRHELHFPDVPFHVDHPHEENVRAVLVFSRSINAWVFVMANRFRRLIWFSIQDQGAWNRVSTGSDLVFDLHLFKGKIYTLTLADSPVWRHVCELTLDPVPKLTLLDTHYLEPVPRVFGFTSSDENLYLMDYKVDTYTFHRLGFDQLDHLTCAPCENTRREYVLFYSCLKFIAALKRDSWAAPSSQYGRFFDTRKRGKDELYIADMWYFPHDCLNPTLMDK